MEGIAGTVQALLNRTGAAFTAVGRLVSRAGQSLTLISPYLSNLLWILSQQFLDLAKNGFSQNAAVYACLGLLSRSVPEPPLIAHVVDNQGEMKQPLPWMHPLQQLIREPNELMTEYEMWELSTLHLGIIGRTVWFKERNRLGDVIALWPLRPDRVGPIYSIDDIPGQKHLKGWSYLVPGTVIYLPIAREDTWFVNLADPSGESGGMVEGLGPLQGLAAEVGADNEATKFVGSLLSNYAAPGTILTTKTPIRDKETAALIKASFQREFGGARRGLPAVLDSDATVTQVGFNLQQLEFPGVRAVSEARIAAAFGVPAILAGLKTGLEAGIRATIAEQREYFAETTLSNYWRRFSESFTRDVAREFGANIVCRFDLRQVNALAQKGQYESSKIATAFGQGAVTLDEYREKVLMLPPLGGDLGASVYVPTAGTLTLPARYVAPNPETAASNEASDAASEEEEALAEAEAAIQEQLKKPAKEAAKEPAPVGANAGSNGHAQNGKAVALLPLAVGPSRRPSPR